MLALLLSFVVLNEDTVPTDRFLPPSIKAARKIEDQTKRAALLAKSVTCEQWEILSEDEKYHLTLSRLPDDHKKHPSHIQQLLIVIPVKIKLLDAKQKKAKVALLIDSFFPRNR